MTHAFDQLPDSARIWIYQGSRKLTESQSGYAQDESKKFVGGWQAHGQPLKADASVFQDQFLVIGVDEEFSLASGCSIDASVNLVRNLGQSLEIDFLDRKKIAFLIDDLVVLYPLTEIRTLVEQGVLKADTLVFNNLVQTVGEWKSSWLIPMSESWLKRHFN